MILLNFKSFLCALFMLLGFSSSAHAELMLSPPAQLLEQAKQGKNELRDVINMMDQNLDEMRDVRTFDSYFFILDDLQKIADDVHMNTIYPDGVKKLGNRMVQKGINWLQISTDSTEKIIYYHRWMIEPQPAFAALYSFEMQVKDLKTKEEMQASALKLEQLFAYSAKKWAIETSLLRLYRDVLSDLAVNALKKNQLSQEEYLFWTTKIYQPDALSEVILTIQDKIYQTIKDSKTNLHPALLSLFRIHEHLEQLETGVTENLKIQLGDAAVDLFMRSLRFEEKLSDEEFKQLISLFQKRHFVSMAAAWDQINKLPQEADFALYNIQKAFVFIQLLRQQSLFAEADALSRVITSKAGFIYARAYNLEGYWEMKDRQGRKRSLNIIFADETMVFADMAVKDDFSYVFFHVTYDIENSGFVASLRPMDTDISANIPIRFYPQPDGTLKVIDLVTSKTESVMMATKTQSYPDLIMQTEPESTVTFNGVYEGYLELPAGLGLPAGPPKKVQLIVNTFNDHTFANLKHPSFFATFNYGNNGKENVLYLTRGNDKILGSWMHLRLKQDENKNLVGYYIDGATGLQKKPIKWKKVRELTPSEEVIHVS